MKRQYLSVDKCFSDSYCDDFEDIIVGRVRFNELEIVYDAYNKICELIG